MNVENYREQNPKEKFLALFDLYLPKISLHIRNLKLAISKKGHHYIQWPSFMISEDDLGKKEFQRYFEFTPERQKEFEKEIFNALEPFMRGSRR